jgi:hypothetical protein
MSELIGGEHVAGGGPGRWKDTHMQQIIQLKKIVL